MTTSLSVENYNGRADLIQLIKEMKNELAVYVKGTGKKGMSSSICFKSNETIRVITSQKNGFKAILVDAGPGTTVRINKRALHTQGLAAGVKSRGKFPGGIFPQWEMFNVGNYFIMPNFRSFR